MTNKGDSHRFRAIRRIDRTWCRRDPKQPHKTSTNIYRPHSVRGCVPNPWVLALELYLPVVSAGFDRRVNTLCMIDTSPGPQFETIAPQGGQQHRDRMTPADIEELFKRTDGVVAVVQQGSGGDEDDDEEPGLTAEETSYRNARLKDVLLEAQSAWDSRSEDLDRIAEKLGDGSRQREWHPAAFQ